MEFFDRPAEPDAILDRVAAEERLLARFDQPARALLLEPWEVELLLGLFRRVRRARLSPPSGTERPRPSTRSFDLFWDQGHVREDEQRSDRFVRRSDLRPSDLDETI
jgi:hypothetical protein